MVGVSRADRHPLALLRSAGARANQQLRIQRFPFPLDQQCSGRPQHSRFSEHEPGSAQLGKAQMAFGVRPAPHIFPSLPTRRKSAPVLILAASTHSSTARFAHTGTGTVRMCFPLPPSAPHEPENLLVRVPPIQRVAGRIQ